jgi:endonuclease/exonuclease/phosphatase family metal-dependent hydrolase
MFIRELKGFKGTIKPQWLLLGDFNLIYKAQDKSNGHLNRNMMMRFRRAPNHLEVKEVDLFGRKFTWTNNQTTPSLSCIDRVFYTPAWEDFYPNLILHPLSSSTSDHFPLMLTPHITPPFKPIFRFEAFWIKMPGYLDCIQGAWNRETSSN